MDNQNYFFFKQLGFDKKIQQSQSHWTVFRQLTLMIIMVTTFRMKSTNDLHENIILSWGSYLEIHFEIKCNRPQLEIYTQLNKWLGVHSTTNRRKRFNAQKVFSGSKKLTVGSQSKWVICCNGAENLLSEGRRTRKPQMEYCYISWSCWAIVTGWITCLLLHL